MPELAVLDAAALDPVAAELLESLEFAESLESLSSL